MDGELEQEDQVGKGKCEEKGYKKRIWENQLKLQHEKADHFYLCGKAVWGPNAVKLLKIYTNEDDWNKVTK